MRLSRLAAVLLVLGALLASMVAEAPAAAADSDEEFPLSMVIKLAPGETPEALSARLADVELEPLITSRGVYLARSPFMGELDNKSKVKLHGEAKEWAKQFDKDDGVLWAEPNLEITAGDLRFHSWQFRAMPAGSAELTGQIASVDQPAFAQMSVSDAHAYATGQGVRVAILDTGVDASHELLAGHVVGQLDLVDDDNDASEEANGLDDDGDGFVDGAFGHGTFVAGVIAQVAPDAEIYALRIIDDEGYAQLYAVIEAIDVAIEMDVDIINLSFGLPDFNKVDAFEDALKRAKQAGILIVAAAGNGGDDRPSYPASHKDVISVAASDENNDALASFSSRGKWVQVAAPGVGIVSSVPGGYAEWAGTSMATPAVSGAVAILLQASTSDKPKDVVKALFEGAREMREKDSTERGVIDVLASLERLH